MRDEVVIEFLLEELEDIMAHVSATAVYSLQSTVSYLKKLKS
jgi:hypothetical protein